MFTTAPLYNFLLGTSLKDVYEVTFSVVVQNRNSILNSLGTTCKFNSFVNISTSYTSHSQGRVNLGVKVLVLYSQLVGLECALLCLVHVAGGVITSH